jgi:hypothetical protein
MRLKPSQRKPPHQTITGVGPPKPDGQVSSWSRWCSRPGRGRRHRASRHDPGGRTHRMSSRRPEARARARRPSPILRPGRAKPTRPPPRSHLYLAEHTDRCYTMRSVSRATHRPLLHDAIRISRNTPTVATRCDPYLARHTDRYDTMRSVSRATPRPSLHDATALAPKPHALAAPRSRAPTRTSTEPASLDARPTSA